MYLGCLHQYLWEVFYELLFFLFYWSLVDLQSCVNFYCTTKWLSYTYICVYACTFISYSFPLWFITGYWIYFPVLYSRTSLFIHSLYSNSLHLLIPNSQSIPLPLLLSLGNHKSVLYVCESVCLVDNFICVIY